MTTTTLHTGPEQQAVTLDEVKSHLRVSHNDDDIYLSSLAAAATIHAENITGRRIITQSWNLYEDAWPGDVDIYIPFGTLQQVDHITYRNHLNEVTTWETSNYIVDLPGNLVRLAWDASWPAASDPYPVNPIEIRFTCGYGNHPQHVPAALRLAILGLVAHWYASREPVVIGTIVSKMPLHVDQLLWQYRLFEGL